MKDFTKIAERLKNETGKIYRKFKIPHTFPFSPNPQQSVSGLNQMVYHILKKIVYSGIEEELLRRAGFEIKDSPFNALLDNAVIRGEEENRKSDIDWISADVFVVRSSSLREDILKQLRREEIEIPKKVSVKIFDWLPTLSCSDISEKRHPWVNEIRLTKKAASLGIGPPFLSAQVYRVWGDQLAGFIFTEWKEDFVSFSQISEFKMGSEMQKAANKLLEKMHDKGLIHNDVRIENFVWSSSKKRMYLMEYGSAEDEESYQVRRNNDNKMMSRRYGRQDDLLNQVCELLMQEKETKTFIRICDDIVGSLQPFFLHAFSQVSS